MDFLRHLFDLWRTYRRGERRVAPRGVRGRVYEPRTTPSDSPAHVAQTKPGGVLKAVVTRADGTVEDFGVIAQLDVM